MGEKLPTENRLARMGFQDIVTRPDGKMDATLEGHRYTGIKGIRPIRRGLWAILCEESSEEVQEFEAS
jgi:hypothetical protein